MGIKKIRKKNPLYVVTNAGRDVEAASNILEAVILKLHLKPLIEFLRTIFQILLDSVRSSTQLDTVQQLLERVINLSSLFVKTS